MRLPASASAGATLELSPCSPPQQRPQYGWGGAGEAHHLFSHAWGGPRLFPYLSAWLVLCRCPCLLVRCPLGTMKAPSILCLKQYRWRNGVFCGPRRHTVSVTHFILPVACCGPISHACSGPS